MSYSCYISFKEMPAENIQDFLIVLQAAAREKMQEIAKANYSFVPYIRRDEFLCITGNMELSEWCEMPEEERKKLFPRSFAMTSRKDRDAALAWAQQLFQYRTYYDKERKLLCMFGMPDALTDLFDGTVYFQNSCDQDYDRESYKGVAPLEAIWDKWNNVSEEEVLKWYQAKYGKFEGESDEDHVEEIGHARRLAAYREIFDTTYKQLLYSEVPAVHIVLFDLQRRTELMKFVAECHEEHVRRTDASNIEAFEAFIGLRPNALAVMQRFSKTPIDCAAEAKSVLKIMPNLLAEHPEYQEAFEKTVNKANSETCTK